MSSFIHSSGDEASSSNYETSQPISGQESTVINSSNSTKDYSISKFNQLSFKLEADSSSNIYIFNNGLFTRTLLPINTSQERQMVVQ
ncbi:hypothetical protein B0T14DRAFT_508766, partial [Immersiella caudata]